MTETSETSETTAAPEQSEGANARQRRLKEISGQIDALEEERRNIYRESLTAPAGDKACEDWLASFMCETEDPEQGLFPRTIHGVSKGECPALSTGYRGIKPGTFVECRPVDEEYDNKTFLAIYLGEAATDLLVVVNATDGIMSVDFAAHNPCMFVPQLGRVIYGFGSWWGPISDEKHLRQITDNDIQNIWYVRALRQLQGDTSEEPAPASVPTEISALTIETAEGQLHLHINEDRSARLTVTAPEGAVVLSQREMTKLIEAIVRASMTPHDNDEATFMMQWLLEQMREVLTGMPKEVRETAKVVEAAKRVADVTKGHYA